MTSVRILATAAALVVAAACGKKGPPLPPLRPIPAAVADLIAERVGLAVTLRFVIPAENVDGTLPPAVDRVEIFAMTLAAADKPPRPADLMRPEHQVASVPVRPADPVDAPVERPATGPPGPGELASSVDALSALPPSGEAPVRYYVAAGMAGRRRGPSSPMVALALGADPPVPAGLAADYTETTLTLTWRAEGAAPRFVIEETEPAGADGRRVAPASAGLEYSTPVEFGRERCFVVRGVATAGAASTIGPPTAPVCVTPRDRFAPPAPAGLLAIAGDRGIELVWAASPAADLAGYLVLRDEGAGGGMQPLMPAPVEATQYVDATVKPGATYAYAVVAVDRATPPNTSPESNRYVVTARRP